MKQPKPSDLTDKFLLRLPDGMRGRIAVAAMQNNRSMTAEIIEALEKAFPEAPGLPDLLADFEYLTSVYKSDGDKREDIRQVLDALKFQVGHRRRE